MLYPNRGVVLLLTKICFFTNFKGVTMRLSTYRKILFAAPDLDLINSVKTTSCSTKWKTASFSVWNRLRSYERVQPAPLKRPLEIPAHIIQPEYVSIPYGIPTPVGKQIEIKTKIKSRACALLAVSCATLWIRSPLTWCLV